MRWAAGALCLLLCAACGGGGRSPDVATSPLASGYIDEVLGIMQRYSINRERLDWNDVRAQVIARAQGAQTILDLYPAIALALGLLDDHHSFYQPASGGWVNNPTVLHCSASSVGTPVVPPDVGYVRIGGFMSSEPGADVAFADAIEDQIRSQDTPALVGWIVDLRGNLGGNMWPMLAGVGSVLGNGVAGYFVPPLGEPTTAWGYRNGAPFSGGWSAVRTTAPYALISQDPRVAVLTDGAVASSGEAITVAFRARPAARSFGSPTCGLSTSNGTYTLSDGAILFLTNSLMADRRLTLYGSSLIPDVSVSGDAEVVERAVAWLYREPPTESRPYSASLPLAGNGDFAHFMESGPFAIPQEPTPVRHPIH